MIPLQLDHRIEGCDACPCERCKGERLTAGLLEHYSTREPRRFLQYDASEPDNFIAWGTWELMFGADTRVLIGKETPADVTVRHLREIADVIERNGLIEDEFAEWDV